MQTYPLARPSVIVRVLRLCSLAAVLTLLAPACGGSDSGGARGTGPGCAIGGTKCAYGCTANLGCTNCVSNADCKDSGRPACVLGQCQECGPGAGCAAGRACFPGSSKCEVQCADNTDCPGDAPICVTDTGVCVGCQASADCAAVKDRPVCDPTRAQCSECAAAADCGAAAPICDLSDGTCHVCLVDGDCHAPDRCGVDRKCHFACSSNADCDAKNPFCDLASRECVACLTNADCGAAAPSCHDGKCVECTANADCRNAAAPFCKGEQCVACVEDRDCTDPAAPLCKGDVCVGCNKDKDCKDPAFPTCMAQRCVAP